MLGMKDFINTLYHWGYEVPEIRLSTWSLCCVLVHSLVVFCQRLQSAVCCGAFVYRRIYMFMNVQFAEEVEFISYFLKVNDRSLRLLLRHQSAQSNSLDSDAESVTTWHRYEGASKYI